jgi:DNA-binding NarL/FixJ family response regulator
VTKVLVVEDDPKTRTWLVHMITSVLVKADVDLGRGNYSEQVIKKLSDNPLDLLVLGLKLSGKHSVSTESFDYLRRVLSLTRCPPVIVIGEGGDELDAVKVMKLGATNFIPKRMLAQGVMTEALEDAARIQKVRREGALWGDMRIPELVGYKIIRNLARTRRSSVYLAFSEPLGQEVVLKLMDRPSADEDDRTYQRFKREYSFTVELESPRLARIFDFGETDDTAYIVMEYFPEGDLKQRMAGPILPKQAVRYIYQICEALETIHAQGIIHRDLKPSNVMLRPDDSLALIDFGLAHFSHATRLTGIREIQGTPHYLSPEQAGGEQVDQRSDLYGLGVILYEMLSGEKPYTGRSALDVLEMHRKDPVPVLPTFVARFQPMLERLMAKDPDKRFSSVEEVMQVIVTFYPSLEARSA